MASEFNATNFYKRLRDDGQLTGIRCNACGNLSPEARPMCASCRSSDVDWHPFSGRATLSTLHLHLGGSRLLGPEGLRTQQPLLQRHRNAGRRASHQRSHHRSRWEQPAVHPHRDGAGAWT